MFRVYIVGAYVELQLGQICNRYNIPNPRSILKCISINSEKLNTE